MVHGFAYRDENNDQNHAESIQLTQLGRAFGKWLRPVLFLVDHVDTVRVISCTQVNILERVVIPTNEIMNMTLSEHANVRETTDHVDRVRNSFGRSLSMKSMAMLTFVLASSMRVVRVLLPLLGLNTNARGRMRRQNAMSR
jgi:hypothetical protein